MKKITFIHCSDLHLDMPFTTLGSFPGKPAQRRMDLKLTFSYIIELVKQKDVKFLLISGDFYEHSYLTSSTSRFLAGKLGEIPGTNVVLIPGNHDPSGKGSGYENIRWSSNVYILEEGKAAAFEEYGVKIYCYPVMESIDKNLINILMFHGTIDFSINEKSFNAVQSNMLDIPGIDYTAAGHFHNKIMGMGANKRIYNPGSPEPLGFDEQGEHGVLYGEITKCRDESELNIEYIITGIRQYVSFDVDVSSCDSNDQILQIVENAIKDKKDLYKVTLKGYLKEGLNVDLKNMTEYLADKVFFIKIYDGTCPDFNLTETLKMPGIKGAFARIIKERIDRETDDRKRELVMKAFYYGMEALERGNVEVGVY